MQKKNLHAKANTVYNALGRSQSLRAGSPLPPRNDCRISSFNEAFPQHQFSAKDGKNNSGLYSLPLRLLMMVPMNWKGSDVDCYYLSIS